MAGIDSNFSYIPVGPGPLMSFESDEESFVVLGKSLVNEEYKSTEPNFQSGTKSVQEAKKSLEETIKKLEEAQEETSIAQKLESVCLHEINSFTKSHSSVVFNEKLNNSTDKNTKFVFQNESLKVQNSKQEQINIPSLIDQDSCGQCLPIVKFTEKEQEQAFQQDSIDKCSSGQSLTKEKLMEEKVEVSTRISIKIFMYCLEFDFLK